MAEYDKVIPPGQTGKILATMHTKNYRGKQTKSIVVVSNDPNNSKISLNLQCSILGIKILPMARAYFNARLGTSQTKEFTIATIGEGPISVYVKPSKPYILAELVKLSEVEKPVANSEYWKQYKLLITIPENFPEGRFAESVTLVTDSQYHPSIKIPVAGVVNPSVVVSPSSLRMRNNDDGTYPSDTLKVTKNNGDGLKISRVITEPTNLKAELIETKKGKQYSIKLTWTDVESKGQFHGGVIIYTNDKQKSVISVPVFVSIK